MKGDKIRAQILGVKIISNADPLIMKALNLNPDQRSLGLITCDIDDITYAALDEATKKANVSVVYAQSCYGGSKNASTKLAGEIIGIIAGSSPAEVKSGMDACVSFIKNDACFYSANEDNSIVYYAQCISSTGSYLSKIAGISEGESIAYLIAPPLEAIYGLDIALKSADVKLVTFYGPPTHTNFGGGLLTGSQSACMAACYAFSEAVQNVSDNPVDY